MCVEPAFRRRRNSVSEKREKEREFNLTLGEVKFEERHGLSRKLYIIITSSIIFIDNKLNANYLQVIDNKWGTFEGSAGRHRKGCSNVCTYVTEKRIFHENVFSKSHILRVCA